MTEPGEIESKSEASAKPQAPAQNSVEYGGGGMPPIGFALLRVNRALVFTRDLRPELSALPMAQLRLLWTVRHMSDATMKDFSERLEVSQSTVTQLADHLIRRKFVERYADENDRRVVRLHLSEFGKGVLEIAEKDGRDRMNAVWETLSELEREKVMTGLELLGSAAEEMLKKSGHSLPPLPFSPNAKRDSTSDEDAASQPVLDLMTRRVRGQI